MYISIRDSLKSFFYQKPIIWPTLEFFQGMQYAYEYFFKFKHPLFNNTNTIRELNLEFASNCNLRCKFCALDHLKPKNYLSAEVLEKTLESLVNDPAFNKVQVLNLYNGGETLLHPKRVEMLELIAKYKQAAKANKKHFPEVWLVTNGMLLRESLSEQIIKMQVLDHVRFSVDGGTPKAFEEMRVNAKWDVFNKNVMNFIRLNKQNGNHTKVSGICIVPKPHQLNTKWMDAEFQALLKSLDSFELRRAHDWAGEIEGIDANKKPWKIGCGMMMHQMVILPNGDVTVCCNDLNGKGIVGNIQQNKLSEIYKSPKRSEYLKLLLLGKKRQIDLCKDCETF